MQDKLTIVALANFISMQKWHWFVEDQEINALITIILHPILFSKMVENCIITIELFL